MSAQHPQPSPDDAGQGAAQNADQAPSGADLATAGEGDPGEPAPPIAVDERDDDSGIGESDL